ncbi:hypothetical protein VTJ04DRAFT_10760 [Mycothermus thermophilus]|uniref:uncharacterized protein n=1 Tax=Humicola insolens TaxID=85995 RepID=UPI003744430B
MGTSTQAMEETLKEMKGELIKPRGQVQFLSDLVEELREDKCRPLPAALYDPDFVNFEAWRTTMSYILQVDEHLIGTEPRNQWVWIWNHLGTHAQSQVHHFYVTEGPRLLRSTIAFIKTTAAVDSILQDINAETNKLRAEFQCLFNSLKNIEIPKRHPLRTGPRFNGDAKLFHAWRVTMSLILEADEPFIEDYRNQWVWIWNNLGPNVQGEVHEFYVVDKPRVGYDPSKFLDYLESRYEGWI